MGWKFSWYISNKMHDLDNMETTLEFQTSKVIQQTYWFFYFPKYFYLCVELKTLNNYCLFQVYIYVMDKDHLVDLISNSMISEIKDLEIDEEKLIANNYLNNLNLHQLRIISKEFIL